jgi:hypothetical protein
MSTVNAGYLCHKAAMLTDTTNRTPVLFNISGTVKKKVNINNTVFKIILTHTHTTSDQSYQTRFPVLHSSNDSTNDCKYKYHHKHDTDQIKHQEGQHVNWFLLQTDKIITNKVKFPADTQLSVLLLQCFHVNRGSKK